MRGTSCTVGASPTVCVGASLDCRVRLQFRCLRGWLLNCALLGYRACCFCRYVVQCLCRSGCVWHLYRSQSGGYLSTVVCLPHLWGCRMLPHTLEPESSGCQFRFFCGFLNAVVLGLRLVSIWVRLHLLEFHAHAVAAVPHSGGNIIPHSLSSRL